MARAIWSGTISFGLVSIPVKLYSATDPKDVRFHQFEEGTGKRIRYKRVAEDTDREVDYEDIVKGYEASKDEFVIVTPEELEAAAPEKTRMIEIEDFVGLEDIDPIYYEKTYYLAPQEDSGASKPYALLLQSMERTGRVGIGRFVLRSKEYLAAVRPRDGILVLETMFFADEIRDRSEIEGVPVRSKVSGRELDMARQLIDSLSTDWDPQKYRDTYRERVLELVEDKAKGREIVVPERPGEGKVVDIMEALRASIEATKKGERPSAAPDAGRKERARREEARLEDLTKDELLERAGDLEISGRSKMTKDELVRAVRKAS